MLTHSCHSCPVAGYTSATSPEDPTPLQPGIRPETLEEEELGREECLAHHIFFPVILKRVEKASEFAISNTYSTRNADLPGRFWRQAVDLATCEQTEYHDDVYEEGERVHFQVRC